MTAAPPARLVAGLALAMGLMACGAGAVGGSSTLTTPTVATPTTLPATTVTTLPATTLPTTTLPTTTLPTTTLPATTTTTSVFVPPPAVMPAFWVGSADGSHVAKIEVATGDSLWVTTAASLNVSGVGVLEVGPDGEVWVGLGSEPASGTIGVLDSSDGSRVEGIGAGGHGVARSPDGRWVATASESGLGIGVQDMTGQEKPISLFLGRPYYFFYPAWSLDSSRLAVLAQIDSFWFSLLLIDPFTATSLGDATVLFEPEPTTSDDETATSWGSPAFTDLGLLVTEEQRRSGWYLITTDRGVIIDPATGAEVTTITYEPGIVVNQDTDPSGHYVIYVLDDGSVHWLTTSGESGTLADGGYSSASW